MNSHPRAPPPKMPATALATVFCALPRNMRATKRVPARSGLAAVQRSPNAAAFRSLRESRGSSARGLATPTCAKSVSAAGAKAGALETSLAASHLALDSPGLGLTLPLADVELCSELDGTVLRAHRGVLAMHSRVFAEAFKDDKRPQRIVVVGKSGPDLLLMLSWMYRCERFTKVRRRGKAGGLRFWACHGGICAHDLFRRTTLLPLAL